MDSLFWRDSIVVTRRLPRMNGQRTTRFADELHGAFVEADLGVLYIIRLGVQIQYILHMPDKLRTHTGNTPAFILQRLRIVFLRTRRTGQSEISSPS